MNHDEKKPERILGRRLARELTSEELEKAAGGRPVAGGASTWSMSNPPDGPYNDSTGGGGWA